MVESVFRSPVLPSLKDQMVMFMGKGCISKFSLFYSPERYYFDIH